MLETLFTAAEEAKIDKLKVTINRIVETSVMDAEVLDIGDALLLPHETEWFEKPSHDQEKEERKGRGFRAMISTEA